MNLYYTIFYYIKIVIFYFNKYIYTFDKKEKKKDNNTLFFEKTLEEFNIIKKNNTHFNKNFEYDLYELEKLNNNNDLLSTIEEKWKKNIIMKNTPVGNVFMYYDIYRLAFAYYGDNYVPINILNAVAMHYVKIFLCLNFYVNEKDLINDDNDHIENKFIHILKKYHELINNGNEKKKYIESDVFKKKKTVENIDEEKPKEIDYFKNKFVYKGKFINLNFLNSDIIYPVKKKINNDDSMHSELNRISYKEYKNMQ